MRCHCDLVEYPTIMPLTCIDNICASGCSAVLIHIVITGPGSGVQGSSRVCIVPVFWNGSALGLCGYKRLTQSSGQ